MVSRKPRCGWIFILRRTIPIFSQCLKHCPVEEATPSLKRTPSSSDGWVTAIQSASHEDEEEQSLVIIHENTDWGQEDPRFIQAMTPINWSPCICNFKEIHNNRFDPEIPINLRKRKEINGTSRPSSSGNRRERNLPGMSYSRQGYLRNLDHRAESL